MISIIIVTIYTSSSIIAQHIFPHIWGIGNSFGLYQQEIVWLARCNSAPVPLSLCALICINPKQQPKFENTSITSFEFHIIGATLVPQPLWLYNILCGGTPLIQLSIEKHAKPTILAINAGTLDTPHSSKSML